MKTSGNKLGDFKKGMRVKYVPSYMRENPDCSSPPYRPCGVVKAVSEHFVFVIYDNLEMKMTTGDEPYTAASTKPEDLDILEVGSE